VNFEQELQAKTTEVDKILKGYLPKATGAAKNIMEAMEYSLMSEGKRIRPILMKESFLLFNQAKGDECSNCESQLIIDEMINTHNRGAKCSDCESLNEKDYPSIIQPFMAALEMIHTYSLVHDDLPAMDNDEYRRGRKTTHIMYGEDMGILAGDALLNYAFETAVTAFEIYPNQSMVIGKALKVLANKAGIYGMIGGQVIDIESAGSEISKDLLDEIYALKTAALMEAAMMIGGILGGANQEEVKILESIAGNVGMAFQIQDDILDVTSTLEVLGKAINSDKKNQKTTYVTLKSLEEAKDDVKRLSNQAIDKLQSLGKETSFLEELLLYLIYRKH
jgi:geranylgeranyl diphosphate synthase type II